MRERLGRKLIILIMAVVARIILMTRCARAVRILPGAGFNQDFQALGGGCGGAIVAIATVVPAVTAHAIQTESLDMLIMPEHHIRPGDGCETSAEVFFSRRFHSRMHPADDVIGRYIGCGGLAIARGVAFHAGVLVGPFAMAVETLPVIRTFE